MTKQKNKNSEQPKCKKCGCKIYKNGIRNGHQRWRCSNSNCNYNYTEGRYISKPRQQAINFIYNFISTLDDKTGDEITLATENLAQTDIKCNEDKKIEVEVIRIDKNKNETIKNMEIPAISYIVYIEKNKEEAKKDKEEHEAEDNKKKNTIKMICLRYIDKAEFNHGQNEFSVTVT